MMGVYSVLESNTWHYGSFWVMELYCCLLRCDSDVERMKQHLKKIIKKYTLCFFLARIMLLLLKCCSVEVLPTETVGLLGTGAQDGRHSEIQELCESRGGRPGLSVLTSLLVSVDVKLH